ncbi:hypothetical protein D3C74_336740 [compost metagenome]
MTIVLLILRHPSIENHLKRPTTFAADLQLVLKHAEMSGNILECLVLVVELDLDP